MALTLITGPSLDPVTVMEVKAQSRIDSSDEDGWIAGKLLSARDYVEAFIGRRLITQTWDLTLDRFPRCIFVPTGRVQSVTFVKYVDVSGDLQTLDPSLYQVDTVSTIARILPAYGHVWPVVYEQMNAVTIRLVIGYGDNPSDVPESIREAIHQLVAHWFENREAVNVGNIVNEMPFSVKNLLWPYRVFY